MMQRNVICNLQSVRKTKSKLFFPAASKVHTWKGHLNCAQPESSPFCKRSNPSGKSRSKQSLACTFHSPCIFHARGIVNGRKTFKAMTDDAVAGAAAAAFLGKNGLPSQYPRAKNTSLGGKYYPYGKNELEWIFCLFFSLNQAKFGWINKSSSYLKSDNPLVVKCNI